MNKVVQALIMTLQHLIRNFSNYCLLIGMIFILYYIKITYGVPTLILSIGVVSVLTSLIVELNKKGNNRNRSGW